jgi:DNA polymerase-4
VPNPITSRAELERLGLELLAPLMPVPKGVRLLGITLSALETDAESPQMRLEL